MIPLFDVLDKDGEARMTLYYNKIAKGFRLKNIYQPKTYAFRTEILRKISVIAVRPTKAVPGVGS